MVSSVFSSLSEEDSEYSGVCAGGTFEACLLFNGGGEVRKFGEDIW